MPFSPRSIPRLLSVSLVALGILSFASETKAEIVIATVGPMTGQYASIGEQMAKGAQMAVRHINAAGGILGQQVRLEVMDDVCDPQQATSVANQLVNRRVAFIAGHFCSAASIPASDIYDQEGIIMITPASTSPTLTERGLEHVFRICGRDDQQGAVAAHYISTKFAGKEIAIVHDKSAYGRGLADVTRAELHQKGIQEKLFEAINPGERDFSTLVTKLRRHGVEVLYLGGYHTEAGLIKRQAKDQGLDLILISGDSLITTEYWTITGNTGRGTFMTFAPDPRLNEKAKPIVADFRASNYEPEGYTLYNYAAVQVFAQAATKAGSLKNDALTATLKQEEFATVLGAISFDEKGDNEAPGYVLYEWKDGNYTQIPEKEEEKAFLEYESH